MIVKSFSITFQDPRDASNASQIFRTTFNAFCLMHILLYTPTYLPSRYLDPPFHLFDLWVFPLQECVKRERERERESERERNNKRVRDACNMANFCWVVHVCRSTTLRPKVEELSGHLKSSTGRIIAEMYITHFNVNSKVTWTRHCRIMMSFKDCLNTCPC